MLAFRKLSATALMALPLTTSASVFGTISGAGSRYGTSVDNVGGISCIYDINKYSCTRSYALLHALYDDIHKKINADSSPVDLVDFRTRHRNRNPAALRPDSSIKDIYLAMFNAQYFVPADLYVSYVDALCKPSYEGILECYKILSQIFCRRYKREAYLRCLIEAACCRLGKGGDVCRVTHIGFFTLRKIGADYFIISRNGRVRRTTSKLDKCTGVFYLPRECLSLHTWMKFSLEFDAFILEQLKCFFHCDELYNHWMALYRDYTHMCSLGCEIESERCSIMYVNLKIFSFFIVASIMPDCSSSSLIANMHESLINLFCDTSCKFTDFIWACLSTFNK